MARKFYMGGVCGMGMAPLAAFLKDGGNDVSGFDDRPNPQVKSALEKIGVKVDDKIAPAMREDFDRFVISTALLPRRDSLQEIFPNAEILQRGKCWAEICAPRRLTAVVGSHGKSSVSALLAHAVTRLNLDCGYLVGAIPHGFSMHKYCGEGDIVISEIDESDGTIEKFSPEVTVALNADLDHTDTYADNSRLEEMFTRLFARTKRLVIYPSSDEMLGRIARKSKTPSIAIDVCGDFTQINIQMAHAALESTFQKLFDISVFDSYAGLFRRQETIFDTREVFAVTDYAHHPNEVKAFIDWFMARHNAENPLIVFQPHRYSRTRRFAADFATILGDAAEKNAKVVLLPVYAASEKFDALGTSEEIAKRVPPNRILLANAGDFSKIVATHKFENGDEKIAIAIVGAGDFYFEAKKYFEYEK